MTTRITNKDRFNEVIELANSVGNTALAGWAQERIDQLEKRNSSTERKPSKEKVANDGFRSAILDVMVPGERYSLTDLADKIPGLEGSSSQRMVGLIRSLVNNPEKNITGQPINKVMDGRKTFYELA